MRHFGFNTDNYFRGLDLTLDAVYREAIGGYFMERGGLHVKSY